MVRSKKRLKWVWTGSGTVAISTSTVSPSGRHKLCKSGATSTGFSSSKYSCKVSLMLATGNLGRHNGQNFVVGSKPFDFFAGVTGWCSDEAPERADCWPWWEDEEGIARTTSIAAISMLPTLRFMRFLLEPRQVMA